ncbi:DUF4055 domain-containing protein [Photorhabdus temperata]|uniref:DUF4055 domain-containing protein n=1 Tax=Photorhabdus temperata subsp. temperata Meg1 TaxID=1393735 RepID=A0A081RS73_PHOTE|nr:DUF4055 domain-containing protein [Photorhabdus temperata]KER01526.1 protein of unknown function (DUF4055) [Photorhabdus temperata subsp. temperata Meg1]MCT8349506.1 DUF4055 domain-containing protein [Photorhabdus temperata]
MPDISTPNLDYNNMIEAWDINDALMGGALYMRQSGEQYMPRWPNEDKDSYEKRLAVATLLPAYEETIKQDIGRVFSEPTQLSENVPKEIVELCKNFDLEGNRLDVWAQEWFSLALQYGVAYALVEYPRVDHFTTRTKADEKSIGARPYAVMLNPRQVIGWKSKTIGGKVVITELRVKEVITIDANDFGQTRIEQIRHIIPGHVFIYRKSTDNNNALSWVIFDEWDTSREDIPFVQLYTKRSGLMRASPPLLNLALLNIKHWQSQSEQDNILHVARVPLLSVFGLEDEQELTIGSSAATKFSDKSKQGMEYTEHSGSAIDAGKESLHEIEKQMRQAGAKLLRAENTSTKAIDQVTEEKMQEQSPLYTMANSLEDALDNILQIMAEWLGLPTGGNVDVRTELETSGQIFNPQAVLAIQSLRQGGDIRRIDAIRALQSLKIIDPDTDVESVLDELNNMSPNLLGD